MSQEQIQEKTETEFEFEPRFEIILSEDKKIKDSIVVPGRVLDILASFADSSTSPRKPWNKPPFRKLLKDGSFWQVKVIWIKITNESNAWEKDICVYFDAWDWRKCGYICLLSNDRVYIEIGRDDLWTDVDIYIKAINRRPLQLFNIIRKIKFYEYLIFHVFSIT
ncbi:MAG: hypothetical protein QW215_00080 [Ignisphaera sp.]